MKLFVTVAAYMYWGGYSTCHLLMTTCVSEHMCTELRTVHIQYWGVWRAHATPSFSGGQSDLCTSLIEYVVGQHCHRKFSNAQCHRKFSGACGPRPPTQFYYPVLCHSPEACTPSFTPSFTPQFYGFTPSFGRGCRTDLRGLGIWCNSLSFDVTFEKNM